MKPLAASIDDNLATVFYDRLSPYPLTSYDIEKCGLYRQPKVKAAKNKTIQHNTEYKISNLVFDIDIDKIAATGVDSYTLYDDFNLPPPSFIMINPANGNAHYSYALKTPVLLGSNSRTKPRGLMLKVQRGLTHALQADQNYAGLVSKNPLSDHWQTYTPATELYDLEYLAEYVNMDLKIPVKHEISGLGRNCGLFDELRFWSYNQVTTAKERGGFDAWLNACLIKAEQFNSYSVPLSYSEIKSIAVSVAKWTWTKYTGKGAGAKRGRDNAVIQQWQGELTTRDKQALSAQITNEQRASNTKLKIEHAIRQIVGNGERVTQAKVSKITGINKVTISRKYRHLFS